MLKQFTIEASGIKDSSDTRGDLLVFVAPDDRERELIGSQFKLDEYDVASTLDPDEIPRLECAENRALVIWKAPESARVGEAVELGVLSIGLVLAEDRLAFILEKQEISFATREYRNVSNVHDVLLGFLLQTIRHYVGHLRVIKQLSIELEKKITISMENRHLLQMFELSESLIFYVDALDGDCVVLGKLRGLGNQLGFNDRQLQLLDDIILESNQALRQANIYSSVLSGLMDARGSIVNNNMNVLLKNLMLVNIVFLPLNLIASMGGMSEWTMMTQGLDWRISYGLFTVGMVLFGWLMWVVVTRLIDTSETRAQVKLSAMSADRRLTSR